MAGMYPEVTDRVEEESHELDRLLLLLLLATTPQEKQKLLRKVDVQLGIIHREVFDWSEEILPRRVFSALRKSLVQKDLTQQQIDQLVRNVRVAITEAEVALARTVRQKALRNAKTQGTKKSSDKAVVEVVGTNGRVYRYDPAYYIDMTATMAVGQATTDAVLSASETSGNDLVQISPNPSTIGDFCDAYKGKVFSISGTHSFYHPLSWVPNGKPPFHVWCAHYLLPFTGGNDESLRDVDDSILALGRDGASTNEIQNEWAGRGSRR